MAVVFPNLFDDVCFPVPLSCVRRWLVGDLRTSSITLCPLRSNEHQNDNMFSFASSDSSTIVSSAGGDYRAFKSGSLLVAGEANPRRPKSTDHEHRQLLRLTGFKVRVTCYFALQKDCEVVAPSWQGFVALAMLAYRDLQVKRAKGYE